MIEDVLYIDIRPRSPPLNVEDLGSVHFRMKDHEDNQARLMSADVKLGGSTIFIVISDADSWPFVIENASDYAFTIYQSVSGDIGLLKA